MSTHVNLKNVGVLDNPLAQWVRVRTRPSGDATHWSCGNCFTVVGRHDLYRILSKTCSDHSCLIPKD